MGKCMNNNSIWNLMVFVLLNDHSPDSISVESNMCSTFFLLNKSEPILYGQHVCEACDVQLLIFLRSYNFKMHVTDTLFMEKYPTCLFEF